MKYSTYLSAARPTYHLCFYRKHHNLIILILILFLMFYSLSLWEHIIFRRTTRNRCKVWQWRVSTTTRRSRWYLAMKINLLNLPQMSDYACVGRDRKKKSLILLIRVNQCLGTLHLSFLQSFTLILVDFGAKTSYIHTICNC